MDDGRLVDRLRLGLDVFRLGCGHRVSGLVRFGNRGVGFAVLTSRGPPSTGPAGFGGSGLPAGFLPFITGEGLSANEVFDGMTMLRWRARRLTNCRATTSSMVLDALLTSIPWSRFNSAITS